MAARRRHGDRTSTAEGAPPGLAGGRPVLPRAGDRWNRSCVFISSSRILRLRSYATRLISQSFRSTDGASSGATEMIAIECKCPAVGHEYALGLLCSASPRYELEVRPVVMRYRCSGDYTSESCV